jgi:taurine dioxygenase
MATLTASIEVFPLAPALGAEVRGVDIGTGLDDRTFQKLLDALHRHSVLVLRGQRMSPQQQVAFSGRLGPLRTSFYNQYAAREARELTVVSNVVENGKAIGIMDAGSLWHTDASYLKTPDMYTQLYALEIPHDDSGKPLGDTLFASTAAAYEALPADVKRRIEGRRAIHSFAWHYEKKRSAGFLKRDELTPEQKAKTPDMAHPIVRTHPVTGRKSIFITEGHTARIEGMEEPESRELLDFLSRHITQPQFIYRHEWKVGDVITWDNCATQHLASFDYSPAQRRILHRAGIAGGIPV